MGRIIRSIRHRLEDRRERRAADPDEPVQPRRDTSPSYNSVSSAMTRPPDQLDDFGGGAG